MTDDKLRYIDRAIQAYYEQNLVSERLTEAILYSVNAGGKRIRPMLLLAVLEAFGHELTMSHYQVAAALEMIHTGSLIHDDLPAMDNDDYRRGRLTNHKQFDEATAILAGDSLFLDPFGLIAQSNLSADIKINLILELANASGSRGMVGGQMLDIEGESTQLSPTALNQIHANKTGQLLTFPFVAAGILAKQSQAVLTSLRQAGQLVGMAFQVRDDILDLTASFEELGKTPQKDLAADKATYPSLLGLEQSKTMLDQLLNQSQAIFQTLEEAHSFDQTKVVAFIERLRLNG
ncbi:polyprenyl synthetase family protein [Streptococcus ferus]|uniref:polyprenyl synthetase family protein n=1 Tax=Streptococcus ferus TaxID=1345 RepID=UPI00351158E1